MAQSVSTQIEVDLRDAVPPMIVKFGGASLGTAGFFVAASGLQLFAFFYLTAPQTLVAATLVSIGVMAVMVAPMIIKGRAWAAILGTGIAVVGAIVCFGWLVYALWATLFSPMLILATLTMGLALLAQPFTILPSFRVSAARKALYA